MRMWRVYDLTTGGCYGNIADETMSEEEALEMAQETFGADVYVELKEVF